MSPLFVHWIILTFGRIVLGKKQGNKDSLKFQFSHLIWYWVTINDMIKNKEGWGDGSDILDKSSLEERCLWAGKWVNWGSSFGLPRRRSSRLWEQQVQRTWGRLVQEQTQAGELWGPASVTSRVSKGLSMWIMSERHLETSCAGRGGPRKDFFGLVGAFRA